MKSLWKLDFKLKSNWRFVTTSIGCPFCHQWISVGHGEVDTRFKYCSYCGKKLTIEDSTNETQNS